MNERTEYIEKVSTRVRVYTPTVMIEGSHHHPPGVRISDLLRNQATGEKYMLLTDAKLIAPDGAESHAGLVLINTAHASVILPMEDESQSRQPGPSAAQPAAEPPAPAAATPEKQGFGLG
jgi:hypothetical protein